MLGKKILRLPSGDFVLYLYFKILMMKLYTEKPRTVEAMQYDGTEKMAIEIAGMKNFEGMLDYKQKKFSTLWIEIGGKEFRVDRGDYIIQDWEEQYSIMSEKIFEKFYKELV